MSSDKFLDELDARLEENRRLAENSSLPKVLQPIAGYLAFHHVRVLLLNIWSDDFVVFFVLGRADV